LVRWIIASGYPEPQQALTVRLTRLLLLQPILLGIGGLAMAVLNAFRRFLLTSLAPLVYNLSIIAGAAFLGPRWGIDGLVAGVLIGAALYLPVLLPGLRLCRARYVFSLDWREAGVREVGRLLLPRILGQAAFQVNFVAITALASFPGSLAVTAINYAYRLLGFPLAILGVSLGTVAFPTLAALANQGQMEDFCRTLSRVVRVALFLALPAAALLLVLRLPLIRLLFERGEFGPESTLATAQAFCFFALGLPAACVTEILLRAFYALHDTRTPVAVGAAIVALNVALGAGLLQVLGFAGLALSFSFTNSLETGTLLFLLRRRLRRVEGKAILRSGLRSLTAAMLAAGATALLLWGSERHIPTSGVAVRALYLAFLALMGAGLYLALAALLHRSEVGEAWALLRRRIRPLDRKDG
ncbi:MAG: murein biosynthesis integral membrane protein MurJ, partial [Chloroflexia bacterium]